MTIIPAIVGGLIPLIFAPYAIFIATGWGRIFLIVLEYGLAVVCVPIAYFIYGAKELIKRVLIKEGDLDWLEDEHLGREDLVEWVRLHEDQGVLEKGIACVFRRCMEVGNEGGGKIGNGWIKDSTLAAKDEYVKPCLVVDVNRKIDEGLKEAAKKPGFKDYEWVVVLDSGREMVADEGYWMGGKVKGTIIGVVQTKVECTSSLPLSKG